MRSFTVILFSLVLVACGGLTNGTSQENTGQVGQRETVGLGTHTADTSAVQITPETATLWTVPDTCHPCSLDDILLTNGPVPIVASTAGWADISINLNRGDGSEGYWFVTLPSNQCATGNVADDDVVQITNPQLCQPMPQSLWAGDTVTTNVQKEASGFRLGSFDLSLVWHQP